MRAVMSHFWTGWQDVQEGFWGRRGTWSSCHPVILSALSRAVPVLDPGFWGIERQN
jgi:hypothetical protein